MKHCVLFVFGNEDDNVNAYSDNIVFYYFIFIYIYIYLIYFSENCVVLLSLYWQKKIKICQKVLANDLKDWFITVNNNKKK